MAWILLQTLILTHLPPTELLSHKSTNASLMQVYNPNKVKMSSMVCRPSSSWRLNSDALASAYPQLSSFTLTMPRWVPQPPLALFQLLRSGPLTSWLSELCSSLQQLPFLLLLLSLLASAAAQKRRIECLTYLEDKKAVTPGIRPSSKML